MTKKLDLHRPPLLDKINIHRIIHFPVATDKEIVQALKLFDKNDRIMFQEEQINLLTMIKELKTKKHNSKMRAKLRYLHARYNVLIQGLMQEAHVMRIYNCYENVECY